MEDILDGWMAIPSLTDFLDREQPSDAVRVCKDSRMIHPVLESADNDQSYAQTIRLSRYQYLLM